MSSAADTRTSIGNSSGNEQVRGQVANAPHGLGEVLDRDAVLHLDEAHAARAAEDAVAAVDQLALGRRRRDELGEPRRQRREAPADAAHQRRTPRFSPTHLSRT